MSEILLISNRGRAREKWKESKKGLVEGQTEPSEGPISSLDDSYISVLMVLLVISDKIITRFFFSSAFGFR